MESIALDNEVYFTEAVYLAMNNAEVPCEKVGTHEFKGVPDPITVYRATKDKQEAETDTGKLAYPYGEECIIPCRRD